MTKKKSKRRDPDRASFREHPIEFVLRLFADVRAGEATTVLLLSLDVFLLLTAYYLLKVAREPLILEGGRAEVKTYASAGQALTLVAVSWGYGWLAHHVGRMKLIGIVSLFFVGNLVLFFALGEAGVPLGIPFYLWVGVYSLTILTQFWAFAADIYTDAQGKRLFPIIGIGASVGSVLGAFIPKLMIRFGPFVLMLVAAGLLLTALAVTLVVHRRERDLGKEDDEDHHDQPLEGANGWKLLFADNYLLFIGALALIINCVNTNGEYIFDRTLLATAEREAARSGLEVGAYIESVKSTYFLWVNVVGSLFQLFVVSRIIKYFGVKRALFFMPLVSLVGYSGLAVAPILMLTLVVKISENSLDYSLQNTARNALWLVVPRDAKYKAKQITDTVMVRLGDVLAAGVVWVGTKLALGTRAFVVANVVLAVAWLAVVFYLGRTHEERKA